MTTRTAVIWWVGRSPQPYPLAHLSRSLEADECQDCHHPETRALPTTLPPGSPVSQPDCQVLSSSRDSGTPHNPAPGSPVSQPVRTAIIQRLWHSPPPCPLAHLSHSLEVDDSVRAALICRLGSGRSRASPPRGQATGAAASVGLLRCCPPPPARGLRQLHDQGQVGGGAA